MKFRPDCCNSTGAYTARLARVLATLAGVASLLIVSSSLWADPPGFINAADPDLPAKARGVPKGGALNISSFALEGGETVTLELVRFSVFSEDAELEVVTANGSTTMSPPASAYFRGWSNNDPESLVMIAVSEDGSMRGWITGANGSAWMLESHPGKGKGLQNRKVDLGTELADRTFSCGASELPSYSASSGAVAAESGAPEMAGLATNVTRTAHMIVDTDFEYFDNFGNASDAFEYMGDIFAFASTAYEREIDTNLMIDYARLWADNTDPYSATTTGCGAPPDGTLQELKNEWDGNPIQRTLTHLISGKPGGGCAWVGTLCDSGGFGYGTSMGINGNFDIDDPYDANVIYESFVVAHEIGHNFNSPHSHNYCGIEIADPIDKCVVWDGTNGTPDSCTNATPDLPGLGTLEGGVAADGPGTIMSYCPLNAITFTFGKWHPYGIAAYRQANRMYAHASLNESCMTLEYDGPDLAVYKDCKPDDPALVDDTGICTITVENNGPTIAIGVVTEDLFLSDGTFNFGTIATTNGECTSSTNPQVQSGDVTCDLGEIGSGHSATITIEVMADSPQNVNDRVSVVSDSPDPDMTNNMAEDSLTFYEDADLEVQKICKPDGDAIAGEDTGKCEIFITNHGPSIAKNAWLVDEIVASGPYTISNIFFDAGESNCVGTVDVECNLYDMDVGEVIKVTVEVTSDVANDINDLATVTSDTDDSDTSNNSATGQIHFIDPTADLVVTKQCQPVEPAPAGSTAFCEIFVYNNGPQTAKNVQLNDEIASDGYYEITSWGVVGLGGGTCTVGPGLPPWANADVTCDLNEIPSGETKRVKVEFTSPDDVDVNDIATATSDTDDPDPNNNTASGSVSFYGVANLSIIKTDNPDAVAAGTNLEYTLTVSNDGPSTAKNVVVADQVPAGVVMVSATAGTGSCVMGVPDNALQPTLCGLGDIAPGNSMSITIVVFVLPNSTGVLHNDATVSSDYHDDDNSDNQVTEDTTIIVVTSLDLEKIADRTTVIAGNELKYLLTFTNGGPSTATGVTLVDVLPEYTQLVKTKVLGGVGDCLLSGTYPPNDIVTCTLNDVDPGETFMVVITVLVDPSTPVEEPPLELVNCAVADQDVYPDVPGQPLYNPIEACTSTVVDTEADLWIDKTGGYITQNPGKDIRYTLTVHNDSGCSGDDPQVCGDGGPSDARNVVVFDQLPATNKKLVVTFVSEDCVYDYDTHSVTCETPILAAGDTVFHEIEATPRGRLRAIINMADVSSDTTDPNTGNNHDEMLLIVGGGGQKGTGE